MPRPTPAPGTAPTVPEKGKKGQGKGGKSASGKGKSADKGKSSDGKGSAGKPQGADKGKGSDGKGSAGKLRVGEFAAGGPCKFFGSAKGCTSENCQFSHDSPSSVPPGGPCKFFGSAKGCTSETCQFSHDSPNSVPPCSFKQKTGSCEKGDVCTFRHVPWASAEQARQHYAARGEGSLEISTKRYKQLHRDSGDGKDDASAKVGPEHYEAVVEKEMQLETYGSAAMKMMEKMGYTAGTGLGREGQGRTNLVGPALELERNSQSAQLGVGNFTAGARSTTAERAARLADARAKKHQRVDEGAFVQHNLLSSDESSEGEEEHRKAHDSELRAA